MATEKRLFKPSLDMSHDEPWCLICASVLTSNGVNILGEEAADLQQIFYTVLRAHVPKKPPSDVICKKCDRQIRRLANEKGESAEREVEFMRKTYRKTISEYNVKVERNKQKLKKVAEAFMGNKLKLAEKTPEKKVNIAASKWRLMAKAGTAAANSKIPVPSSNGASSPGKSPSGAATPIVESDKSLGGAAVANTQEGVENISNSKKEVRFSADSNKNGAETKTGEKSPLVKHDSLEKVDKERDGGDSLSDTDNKSNASPNMFNRFRKKKDPQTEKNALTETPDVEGEVNEVKEKVEKASEEPVTQTDAVVIEPVTENEGADDQDGGSNKQPNGDVKSLGDKAQIKDGELAKGNAGDDVKKEKTPLINDEHKVKDTGPGMLCCIIM